MGDGPPVTVEWLEKHAESYATNLQQYLREYYDDDQKFVFCDWCNLKMWVYDTEIIFTLDGIDTVLCDSCDDTRNWNISFGVYEDDDGYDDYPD